MKKNIFLKMALGVALTGAVFVPYTIESYAEESEISTSTNEYLNNYNDLISTINKAKGVKESYIFINSSEYYANIFNEYLKKAEAVFAKGSSASLTEISDATNNLKKATEDLNGQRADIDQLSKLVSEDGEFVKSEAYKKAPANLIRVYVDALNKARVELDVNADTANKTLIDSLVKNLKDAKTDISDSYETLEAKNDLTDEISISTLLRNDLNLYTKESFESFMATLKLAETSVEDKSKVKTAKEYKELRDSLYKARLALVKVNDNSQKVREQIQRLEKAVYNNMVAVKAGETLIDLAPKTVEPVREKLDKLIKKSKNDINEANKLINELKGIKG